MNGVQEPCENDEKSPLTGSMCVAKPVEVEVTQLQDFLYETENQTPQTVNCEEKKPGFWKALFGEKNCKTCSQKKCECTCKSKKKKKHKEVVRGKFEENPAAVFNCSAYGTSRETKKNGNCPTKCNLPINQGCGCHLYFCIDSKRKKQPMKCKNCNNKDNEKIKTERKPFAPIVCDEMYQAVPNVTIFCDESNNDVGSPKNYIQTRNYPIKTVSKAYFDKQTYDLSEKIERNNGTRPFEVFSGEKTMFQVKSKDINFSNIDAINKPKVKDIETNKEKRFVTSQNNTKFGPVSKEDHVFFQQSITVKKPAEKDNNVDNSKFEKNQSLFEDMNKGLGTLRNFAHEFNKPETIVSNIKIDITKSYENLTTDKNKRLVGQSKKELDESKKESDDDSSYLEKEYSNFNRNRKWTRKSTAKSGLFAKNSLITLRKERRQSEMEGRMSLILNKLSHIEDKITELEKTTTKEKDNNITMGIICEGKQSKVAIKFDNPINKEVSTHKQGSVGVGPIGEKPSKTIRISSNNESIYLKTPGDVKVVRSKQQEEDPTYRSKQLIYENAYKMDAHTIGSNSTTIRCRNPKLVVSYSKTEPFCKNPQCSASWRRISEELKKSNLDFVKCQTCGRKK